MKQNFVMLIDDVFYQYGIFVVGKIQSGAIKVFDKLVVVGHNTEMQNLCISIKKYDSEDRTELISVKEALAGDYVRIGLIEGSKFQIRKGMKLIHQQ